MQSATIEAATIKPAEEARYANAYDEKSFFQKMTAILGRVKDETVQNALVLYAALQSSNVPIWAKAKAVAALGYLISPIDLVPDATPFVGLADDVAVLSAAAMSIAMTLTPQVQAAAKAKAASLLKRRGK